MHVGKPPTSVEAGNDRLSNVMLEEENEVETEVEAELRRVQMAKRMSRLKRSSTSFGLSVMGSEQKEFLRRVTLEEKVVRHWKKRTKAAPHTAAPAVCGTALASMLNGSRASKWAARPRSSDVLASA